MCTFNNNSSSMSIISSSISITIHNIFRNCSTPSIKCLFHDRVGARNYTVLSLMKMRGALYVAGMNTALIKYQHFFSYFKHLNVLCVYYDNYYNLEWISCVYIARLNDNIMCGLINVPKRKSFNKPRSK